MVYGEAVDVDGQQLIPVALAWYGFGGGGAPEKNSAADAEMGGGGGGGASIPIGAYIKRDGVLRFEPNVVSLLAVATPFVCVAGWALSRVVRALKR